MLFSIIIVHELGHVIIGTLTGEKVIKVKILPFGGITVFQPRINKPFNSYFLTAIAGIIFQIIFFMMIEYLFKLGFINYHTFNEFRTYHYAILIFNLLPIAPLDGYQIINSILLKFTSYYKSLKLSIIISYTIISILLFISYFYYFNLSLALAFLILLVLIRKKEKNLGNYFNLFLWERYQRKPRLIEPKVHYQPKLKNLYLFKTNYFNLKTGLTHEKTLLNKHFEVDK